MKNENCNNKTCRPILYFSAKMEKEKKTTCMPIAPFWYAIGRVVKLPVIYVGGKLPVTYR